MARAAAGARGGGRRTGEHRQEEGVGARKSARLINEDHPGRPRQQRRGRAEQGPRDHLRKRPEV
eukprot:13282644-Heterocapsa_arctica.AAC.1